MPEARPRHRFATRHVAGAAVTMVPRRVGLTGVLAGVLAVIVLYSLSKWAAIAGADEGRTLGLWVAVLVFSVAGFAVGRAVNDEPHAQRWHRAAAGYGASLLGIAIAVVFWTFLEDLVFSRFGVYPIYEEHNLFPFEIAILWVAGSVPLLAGMVAGVFSRRRRMSGV